MIIAALTSRLVLTFLAGCMALALALAAPAAAQTNTPDSVWDRWSVHNPEESAEVNHTPLTNILEAVNIYDDWQRHRGINYSLLRGPALEYIQAYIDFLEAIPVSRLNRNEQLAFWLNLHNAQVIEILAREGYSNIDEKRGQPGKPGDLWAEKRLEVEGHALSLEDIEQNILIRQWDDPILLYGLCYGVKGSPVVGDAAFSGATVHAQLEDAAREFVNDTSNVRIRGRNDRLQVSSLYVWNKAQLFDNDDTQVIKHLRSYSDDRLTEELQVINSIEKHRFSWRSNNHTPRNFGGGRGGLQRSGLGS